MWFEDQELVFGCTECGDCCRRPGYVFLETRDLERLADHLQMSVEALCEEYLTDFDGEWVMEVVEGSACVFLEDDNRCKIHPVKPIQCRSYPFWPELVDTEADWEEEKQFCPGIDAEGGRKLDAAKVLEWLTLLHPVICEES